MPPKDPYRYFRAEARELLDGLRGGIASLGNGGEQAAAIASLLRIAHTLKGAARVVRLPAMSDLAHELEDVLSEGRDGGGLSPEAPERLRKIIAALEARYSEIDRPPAPVSDVGKPAPPAPMPLDTVRLQITEVNSVLSGLTEVSTEMARLRADVEGFGRASRQARLLHAVASRSRAGVVAAAARVQSDAGELAGELERTRQRTAARLDRIERDLRSLHEEANRLRLLHTGALWEFLQSTANDAARVLGKDVRLEIHCRTPRLDAVVFAGLHEALLHLVRNAVAHGIEEPAVRERRGKPAKGTIRIEAEFRDGRLRVRCADDGGGLDVGAIHGAAAARGWVAAQRSLEMSEAIGLLFRGGLTTTRRADEMSGRGVGVDAVRAAVARLGGELSFESEPGAGTTVSIDLPVAVAAIEALVAESAGLRVLLPLQAVRRVVEMRNGAIHHVAGRQELHLDRAVWPYASLSGLLAASGVRPAASSPAAAVLVESENGSAALGVDRLHGIIEAVVRPLPKLADAADCISATSLVDGGSVRLVFNPDALVTAILAGRPEPAVAVPPPPLILVVDDSLTTRMLEQSILESAGYEVDLAVSGEEALERLRERRYRLMLVDVEMPGMNGFEVIESVRRDPALRDLPAILVTSRESREDRQRGLDAGAQDYVVKGDFDQGRLIRRIRELLT
jgi:two-component system chemotaxis sensor kinase CheA